MEKLRLGNLINQSLLIAFQLRITVWSLVDKSVSYIRYPKHSDQGKHYQEFHPVSIHESITEYWV